MQDRVLGITYLKCFAALFVIYVHIDSLLPEPIQFIAKGGIFVNSLFFFISGFCLTNLKTSFLPWYWKRLVRILIPYLLLLPLIAFSAKPLTLSNVQTAVIVKSYHFIPAILSLYVFYYFAVKLRQRTTYGFVALIIGVVAAWSIYLSTYWDPVRVLFKHLRTNELTVFFLSMLLGAITRERQDCNEENGRTKAIVCAILCVATSCAYVLIKEWNPLGYWKILEAPLPIVWVGSIAHFALSLNDKLPQHKGVETIANLTLEMYIVQFCCIKAYKIIGFPTNVIYLVISVFAIAYSLQYVSKRIIAKIPTNFPPQTHA